MTLSAAPEEPAFGGDIAPAKLEKLRSVFDSVRHDKKGRASVRHLAPVIQDILLQDPSFAGAHIGSPSTRSKSTPVAARARKRLSSQGFAETLGKVMAPESSQDGMLDFPQFAGLMKDVYDDTGRFAGQPSLFRSQAQALQKILVDLEDELETARRSNETMQSTLDSKRAEAQRAVERSQKAADTHVEELDRALADSQAENKRWAAET